MWLDGFFLWFPFTTLSVVAVIFLYRRLWRQLPFFALYLASALLIGAVRRISARFGEWPHFYTYWISDLAGSAFVFLAMYEIFLRRLFAKFHQTRLYRRAFPILAVLILVLTVLTALQAHDQGAAFLMASRGFDFARTALLVFFIALMLFMGRQWTRYNLGVTLGFAIQAAAAMINSAVRARTHYQASVLDLYEVVAYNLCCLIWLITFWKPEKRTQFLPPDKVDTEVLHQARVWESLLKKWLTPGKRVSTKDQS
jgi:hypothetical protein